MIVAIHQPHYLPWLGFLDRMAKADLFILLDHVQFERRNYQNRTMILFEGAPRWLTVPVVQRSQKELIVEKAIDNGANGARPWGPAHFSTLRQAYRDAPHFGRYAPELREILGCRWERLGGLDPALLDFLRDALGISTPLMRSSELGVPGRRGELILNLCRAAGADTLLAGMGGSRGYLDHEAFAREGVRIEYQRFTHPVYAQCGGGAFAAGLSALDMLFHCGPASRATLFGETRLHESLVAA